MRVTVGTAVRQNIFITNNVGTATLAGPFMHFMNVDGVTVTGNQEVVSAGQLAEFIGCTGVTYSGNVTN